VIEARTHYGRVRGAASGAVVVFRGVPYARAPIGSLRLRPPEPPLPWAGVRDATRFGDASLQDPPPSAGLGGLTIGARSEDCLTLNVFTPGVDGARRPVLVWLHGGGFDWGASSQPLFDASRLAARGDVVVVTFNYRLGALGFLQLGALGVRTRAVANAGLLDQVAALAWVRDHVAAFGGDPEQVTLFGESAGAISIACLLAMPRAAGLFRRAILQSGSLQPLHGDDTAATVARELLDELWIRPEEADAIAQVPEQSLLLAQTRVAARLRTTPEWLTWRPWVDGDVLPCEPAAALRAGAARGIPVLVGTNRDECRPLAWLDPRVRPADEAALRARARLHAADDALADRVLAAYRRAAGPSASLPDVASALETDVHFRLPAIRFAELQARHERRTFMYRFDGPAAAGPGVLGACHGIEVPFVFGRTDEPGLAALVGEPEAARALAEETMDAWLAFARTGTPVAAADAWPAYEPALRSTRVLGGEGGVRHDPGGHERRAWQPASGASPRTARGPRRSAGVRLLTPA